MSINFTMRICIVLIRPVKYRFRFRINVDESSNLNLVRLKSEFKITRAAIEKKNKMNCTAVKWMQHPILFTALHFEWRSDSVWVECDFSLPLRQSLFFASSASNSMLTNYSHLLTARANKHFGGLVSHSSIRFDSIRFVCLFRLFLFLGSLQFESVNRNVYMQIGLMNGMVHVNVLRSTEFPNDLFTFYTVTFSSQIRRKKAYLRRWITFRMLHWTIRGFFVSWLKQL